MNINIYIPGVSFEEVIAKFMPRYEAFSPVAKEKFREGFEKELLSLVQDRLAVYSDAIELEIGGSALNDRIKAFCPRCRKRVFLRREWQSYVTSYVGQYATGGFFPLEDHAVSIDESIFDQVSGFYCPECGEELFANEEALREHLEKPRATLEASYTPGQFFEDYIEDSIVFEGMPEVCWDYLKTHQEELYEEWRRIAAEAIHDETESAEIAVRVVLKRHDLDSESW